MATRRLVVMAVLAASTALAVEKNGTVYVRVKDAKLLPEPSVRATAKATLKANEPVTWLGPASGDRRFHAVRHQVLGEGFTLATNLSPSQPATEVSRRDDGKPIDAQAFLSSGAATKALSETAGKYAGGSPSREAIAAGLRAAEKVSASVTPEVAREFVARSTGAGR